MRRRPRTPSRRRGPAGPGRGGTATRGARRMNMPGRGQGKGRGASRGLRPTLEGLDRRVLLSWGGAGPALGSYVVPASARPRPNRPAITVDPHNTVNHFLGNKL